MFTYSICTRSFLPAIFFVLLLTSGCSEADTIDDQPDQLGERTAALSEEAQADYTVLSAEERAQAERQPWEEPGLEVIAPPQKVLDGQSGDRESFVPDPDAVAELELLYETWEAKQYELTNIQGMSTEDADQQFDDFVDSFIMEKTTK